MTNDVHTLHVLAGILQDIVIRERACYSRLRIFGFKRKSITGRLFYLILQLRLSDESAQIPLVGIYFHQLNSSYSTHMVVLCT